MLKVAANRVEGVSCIKDKICDVIYKRNEQLISPLVSLFSPKVSVRRRESIEDINGLFDTLDRLNLGSVHNLWAFMAIADFLKDPELVKLIADVGQLEIPDGDHCFIGRNLYAYRRTHKTVQIASSNVKTIDDEPPECSQPAASRIAPPVYPLQIVQTRTFDLLACEIGKRWRELGRHLGFHEADLDEFEDRHTHNLRERIYAMLQEYARGHNSNRIDSMISGICTALEKCRRVDLRKRVQQFMAKRS